ncbi:hypothetical protein L1987_28939 [Smallanthus sonchifolius]|uniref:Uncharacterized protein n=1 Tax=Smallanthus sonchifolius TaxID=185202 RepID=A0ACB9HYH1_9ASTR|nr:hypothetical protein L1987_28939 [Smallanthus sonchifolius]
MLARSFFHSDYQKIGIRDKTDMDDVLKGDDTSNGNVQIEFDVHGESVERLNVEKDVVECLQKALSRRGIDMNVAALVNDSVGTLAVGHFLDKDTVAAVVIGTGTNACYLKRSDVVIKCQGLLTTSGGMVSLVINMEWGNLPRTAYDIDLDAESQNPNDQGFEKMISGMFLGTRGLVCDVIKLPSQGQVSACGKLEAGALRNGSKVLVLPSRDVGTVRLLERDSLPCAIARAGDNVAVSLQGIDANCVLSGGVLCHPDFPVAVSDHLELKILVLDVQTPILIGSQSVVSYVKSEKKARTILEGLRGSSNSGGLRGNVAGRAPGGGSRCMEIGPLVVS